MKLLRSLIIGIVLGGAFGAKVGAYLSQVLETTGSFQFVELGFALGATLGLTVSLIIWLMNSGVFDSREKTESTVSLAGQSS